MKDTKVYFGQDIHFCTKSILTVERSEQRLLLIQCTQPYVLYDTHVHYVSSQFEIIIHIFEFDFN